tara:strand:- start:6605 stop:7522 length:918 start_codon:yes stop_codon:yes gene_type:complete
MVNNSKILVAGGTGFIGSSLIKELISKGNQVVSISINSKGIKNKVKNAIYISHDLNKPINTNKFLDDFDYLVNCSGYVNHIDYLKGGKEIFNTHFESCYNLANLAMELNIKTFINIGSSDEYGDNKSPLNESIREKPISPYALGKLTATHYLQRCFRQGYLNTVVIRPFLVFGESQNQNRFLPYLINNCINDREFKVSKGEQIRDYLYIKDFTRALINTMGNEKAYGEVINIASGIPISIKEVINYVQEIIGTGKPLYGSIDYRRGENMELYANIEKAKKILNWEPIFDFKNSVKNVINWYLKNV